MAISDIKEYAHLTEQDVEALGFELDALRRDVTDSLGERDASYICRTIAFQRTLDAVARLLIHCSRTPAGVVVATTALGVAKSIENMEIGHNVSHGQWDWMNDPEIHSSTWEWDMVGLSSQWRYSHNYRHHVFSNVVGMDEDLGYGVLRITRDQPWKPEHLLQPLRNLLLAATFEWGIALHDLYSERSRPGTAAEKSFHRRALIGKIARQTGKDYLLFPSLSGRRWRRTLTANLTANLLRNVWTYVVIFCGHFPDGAEKFTLAERENETPSEWYLRQKLGTANFRAGPVMAFLSGNLCYQIEHHLFPDLPSNRYAEISTTIRALCEKYDLPYTTGSLVRQYLLTLRTIHKLALPDRFLRATCEDAPETASELKFRSPAPRPVTIAPGHRVGLRTALRARQVDRHRRRRIPPPPNEATTMVDTRLSRTPPPTLPGLRRLVLRRVVSRNT
ncbi:fatty acid desaturase family protein [Rhodococcus sp. AQ5-07]|uniref:fatty acid desaturase family protein n=1 Tax=Rhodococcus sp. AQ5-07 TaxID=2054902 RepID=UPI000DBF8E88|nr:acyl-CoA desaturase [Rhodococcus sp. AQ5-07]RAL30810.1 acyl-CoA desaturase [Rhodococcus sp. AQ5-07]